MHKRKDLIVYLLIISLIMPGLAGFGHRSYAEDNIRWYEVKDFETLESTIRFSNMKYIKITEDIMLTKPINITRDMVIVGGGDTRKKLRTYNTIHFTVKEGVKLSLENLEFVNDHAGIDIAGKHGGIDNDGELSIDNCAFIGNQGYLGGAIDNKGTLNLRDSFFKDNLSYDGGAIKNRRELNLYGRNDFIANSSLVFGGAISNIYNESGQEIKKGESSVINLYGETNFKDNEAYSGGAIGGDLIKDNEKIVNFREDSTTIFEANKAHFEEDDGTKSWGEGGAIYNNEINGMDDSYIEFRGNKAKAGGAIALTHSEQNINITSSRGVAFDGNDIEDSDGSFKPPSGVKLKENDGVDIAISNRNSLNIGYGSFMDKKYDKKSNIYISTESKVHGEPKPGDNELILKNSQVDVLGNFIVFDRSLDEEFDISIDETRLEGLKSLVARLPEEGELGPGSLRLNMEKSNLFTEDFELVLGDIKDRVSTDLVNNTIEVDTLVLNTRGEVFHNTIKSEGLSLVEGSSLENNLIVGSILDDSVGFLGDPSKIVDGEEESEGDILYKKDNKRNIYVNNSSDKLLEEQRDPYLKVGALREFGSEESLRKLEHYRPLENSLAKGFEKLASVERDAVNKPRAGEGQGDVTMGSIEGDYSKKVVVEFDANGGLIDSLAREDIRVTKGGSIEDLDSYKPVREGYKFTGWFLDRETSQEFDSQKLIDNFTVLYAGWEREVYKMKLDGNGGSFKNEEKDIELAKGDTIEEPSRKGYKFLGWSTDPYGEPKETDDIQGELDSLEENKKYYAIWEAYAMTLEANGGSFSYDKIEVLLNRGQTIEEPIRDGYKFLGWSTSLDGQVEKTSKELQTSLDRLNEDLVYYGVWKKNPRLKLEANGGSFKNGESISILSKGDRIEEPIRDGYKFLGWSTSPDGQVEKTSKELQANLDRLNEDLVYYGVWVEKDYPSHPVESYKMKLDGNGGSFGGARDYIELAKGDRIEEPVREGYKFLGWSTSQDGQVEKTSKELEAILDSLDRNRVYYGVWTRDLLDKDNHKAYIKGYSDNTIRPKNYITREEVAMVFYRLLDDETKKDLYSEDNDFKDVKEDSWANIAISSLTKGGILEGYPDKSFRPGASIRRGEVTAIIARFEDLETGSKRFIDIDGHWSEDYIISASEKGWIEGYEDGSFRPDDFIRRGEFVTIVNNILERKVREENILEGIIKFKDLDKDDWYYDAMVEAANSHSYKGKRLEDGSEIWLELIENDL